MAIERYDQRKNYEEAEANAIGTEMVRAGLLPPADASKVRLLLRSYLDQRVSFYTTRDGLQLREINARTAELQGALWSAVEAPAKAEKKTTKKAKAKDASTDAPEADAVETKEA